MTRWSSSVQPRRLFRSTGTASVRSDSSTAVEAGLDAPAGRQVAAREPERDGQVERAGRQVVGETGIDPDIGQVDVARRVQEDRPGDPAVPPLVLVLDEGRIRPLDDAQRQGVGARPDAAGQVELRGEVGILPDPDLLAVEADDQDALGGPDMEHDPPIGPVRGNLEFALVDAGRVRLGDLGRKALERHLDVRVVRQVRGPGHRPDARDVGLAPVGSRVGVGRRQQLESPAAIEREPLPVDDAVHGESADPRQFGVVPRSGHKNDCGTLRQTGQRDHARPRDAPSDRPGPPIR